MGQGLGGPAQLTTFLPTHRNMHGMGHAFPVRGKVITTGVEDSYRPPGYD